MRHGKYPFIIGFLAVPVALYGTFVVAAYIQTFQLAFTSWSGLGPITYNGFDNFERLWNDDLFWRSVGHNLYLLILLPIITIAIALVFAFLLNEGGGMHRGVRGSKFYRVIFFFPQLMALAIVAVIFGRVFSTDESGMLNGLFPDSWSPWLFLADERWALTCILAVMVWQAVGFYVVLFSAGMGSIEREVYEAAALDGASRISVFFKITIPLLWGTLQVAWVYLGIAAFDAFALVNIMSVDRGGPDGATSVLSMMIYRNAFEYSQAGYASAIGVALFFLTLTFAALTLRVTRREAH
ncbi:putative ABC transporter permease protein [Actinoplanes missouriensis 431]|uniref:Putative ABC transporter permease protein n=1 Tax=Actinoplanes missouriensis (strain ATCC 14538 / DSM 43046 / CBS 188.64 / JCM 3121 / NBRC 102363 / NCIMB 12654 / NRRL B-3342 / UNCC 431) TaxID=512565 RepID=I0H1N0_ACTM4|nr:sugar ABC transporter permease [Actinoplanes missouriensis]BAL86917.1 putative ABC transporter permease protein [Actinoplanes missouriensis 431]